MTNELREKLADMQHEIWSHWMRYLFSCGEEQYNGTFLLPGDKVERWKQQMNKPYSELTEKERESDREQADKILSGVDVIKKVDEFARNVALFQKQVVDCRHELMQMPADTPHLTNALMALGYDEDGF